MVPFPNKFFSTYTTGVPFLTILLVLNILLPVINSLTGFFPRVDMCTIKKEFSYLTCTQHLAARYTVLILYGIFTLNMLRVL